MDNMNIIHIKMKKLSFKFMILIAAVSVLTASCSREHTYTDVDEMIEAALKSAENINVKQLYTLIDEGEMILMIDVREPNEYNAGYIPGAVNIPRGTLEFRIGNEAFWDEAMLYMPEKQETIILYCKKGKRSILAAQSLHNLGYANVKFVDGGWKKWELTYPLIYEKNLDQMHHEDEGEVGGC